MMLLDGAIKVEVEKADKNSKGAVVRFLQDCYIYADESHGYHFHVNDTAYVPIDRLKPCGGDLFIDRIFSKPSSNAWMMGFKPMF